jgi:hypothetical protein
MSRQVSLNVPNAAKRPKIDAALSASALASFVAEQETRLKSLSAECPVLSIVVPDAPPDLDVSSDELLDQMVYPISKETFLDYAFRKKALHITGPATKSRIQTIVEELHHLDPEYLFQETSSDNVFVWLQQQPQQPSPPAPPHNNGHSNHPATIQSIEVSDPQQALLLHQVGGHATYCRAPPSVEQPMVANLLKATGFGCGQYDPSGESVQSLGRGEVEVFRGTRHHTTQWHYDFQENFTIQLSGRKTWMLQQGTTQYPIRACTPHYAPSTSSLSTSSSSSSALKFDTVESQLKVMKDDDRIQFGHPHVGTTASGSVQTVTLNAGDVLYFPAGMWHHVTTVEPGVSINVSLMATNYATVVCQALQHLLLQQGHGAGPAEQQEQGQQHLQWRETIHAGCTDRDVVLQKLQGLLETLPKIIQDFTNTYGAFAILPPIVRQAPSFQLEGHEQDWRNLDEEDNYDEDNDGDDDDDDDDGEGNNKNTTAKTKKNRNKKRVRGEDDNDDDDVDVDVDNEDDTDHDDSGIQVDSDSSDEPVLGTTVVDVTNFEVPTADWSAAAPGPNYHLALNPLGWVRPVDHITAFHHGHAERHPNLYVININYAGNEMLESAVRLVVRDEEHPKNIHHGVVGPREECYLYHGFYCWAKKQK